VVKKRSNRSPAAAIATLGTVGVVLACVLWAYGASRQVSLEPTVRSDATYTTSVHGQRREAPEQGAAKAVSSRTEEREVFGADRYTGCPVVAIVCIGSADGPRVEGCAVTVYAQSRDNGGVTTYQGVTDRAGEVRFSVAAPGALLVTSSVGGQTHSRAVSGRLARIVHVVEAPRRVVGRVVDRNEHGVRDAQIQIASPSLPSKFATVGKSVDDGRFEVSVDPMQTLFLRARKERFQSLARELNRRREPRKLTLRLEEMRFHVCLRVNGPSNTPVAGAEVYVGNWSVGMRYDTARGWYAAPTPVALSSGKRGQVVIYWRERSIEPLTVRAPGLAMHRGEIDFRKEELAVRLEVSPRVTGRVTMGGAPVDGSYVFFGQFGTPRWIRTSCRRDGRFDLVGLPVGLVGIQAREPGRKGAGGSYSKAVLISSLRPGQTVRWDAALELDHTGDGLQTRILVSGGGSENAIVEMFAGDALEPIKTRPTDRQGWVQLGPCDRLQVRLLQDTLPRLTLRNAKKIAGLQGSTMVIDGRPAGSVSIRATGRPELITNVALEECESRIAASAARTKPWEWRFAGVPPGRYQIRVKTLYEKKERTYRGPKFWVASGEQSVMATVVTADDGTVGLPYLK